MKTAHLDNTSRWGGVSGLPYWILTFRFVAFLFLTVDTEHSGTHWPHRLPLMADLPSEIITEILSRLPVKSLLRLRCTCKWWCSLIDSNYFIFLHLNKSHESNIILQHRSRIYQLDSNTVDNVKELNHPLMCHRNRINILGSSNGLLCISNIVNDIAFWNPTIRKHRFLPSEPLNRNDDNTSLYFYFAKVYGFGYDSFSNDFKLVSISLLVNLNNLSFDSKVKLYSLRTDAWKILPSMPYALIRVSTTGVFLGGALHWIASRKLQPAQSDLVVAFDLRFESHREVPLPVTVTGTVNGNLEMNLASLGECLCVIENRSEGFDVWVMKKYGIRDSWCKLFSVEQQQHVVKCLKPLGYSRDGAMVLLEMDRSGELCWYNLASRDIINVTISGMHNSFGGIVCVGSLVPPTLLSPSVYSNKNHKFGVKKKRDDFLSEGFKLRL